MKNFLSSLLSNLIRSFTGWRILLHLAAILLTYLVVLAGFDWAYFTFFQSPTMQAFLFPAVILGGAGVILFIILTFVIGKIKKNAGLVNISLLSLQAAILGTLISSLYKSVTGRGHPVMHGLADNLGSTDFNFGFLEGGVFWGWPSGHATTAFAIGVALFLLFRGSRMRYFALLFSFYVAFGISTNIHWLSDALAGTCIGTSIGLSLGKRRLGTT